MRHLDRFDVFEHFSFKKRHALANYPARKRLFSKMLRDYMSKGTQTRKVMGYWQEHGKDLDITRRTLGRWVEGGVSTHDDWVKSVGAGVSDLPAKRKRVEGGSPSPAKKRGVGPTAAAKDRHAAIMADASAEVCKNLVVAEQEGRSSLTGTASVVNTIKKYKDTNPTWVPCTKQHLLKWARANPGRRPMHKNTHRKNFDLPTERAFAEGMPIANVQELIAEHLTQEKMEKLPNGKVGKGCVTGLLRRVSSEGEQRVDVETPTLDSEVRIGWRHHCIIGTTRIISWTSRKC
jgi:hypothetical protein